MARRLPSSFVNADAKGEGILVPFNLVYDLQFPVSRGQVGQKRCCPLTPISSVTKNTYQLALLRRISGSERTRSCAGVFSQEVDESHARFFTFQVTKVYDGNQIARH